MKKLIHNLWVMTELSVAAGTMQACLAAAQTFTTTLTILHTFTGASDGGGAFAELLLSGDTLYGITSGGGGLGGGTVFSVKTNGSTFKVLYTFSGGQFLMAPVAGLILWGDTLYGTTQTGGLGYGTVFAVNTNGTSFTNLYSFTGEDDGAIPRCPLVLSSNILYGTTTFRANWNSGTLFAINTNGTGFRILHTFTTAERGGPSGRLILVSNRLYGTAESHVTDQSGAVFAINTDGTGFTTLHIFGGSDGEYPLAGLVLLGNRLYGTTYNGGTSGNGTIFALNTDGTSFTDLHNFSAGVVVIPYTGITNSDGTYPTSDLLLSGNTLYGTASGGGIFTNGTVFSINTDGTAFKTLYNFDGGVNGAQPQAGLVSKGNVLYGTAGGGSLGQGIVFSLALTPVSAPQITSQPLSRTNITGSTATFSVLATGTAPLSYQWLKATNAISQQRGSTLTLTNVSSADAATYSVIVSNAAGSVTSAPATLTVIDPPAIVKQPLSQTNVIGSTASFDVVTTGTGPLNYQWFKGANPLSKQTGSNLTLVRLSYADAGVYHAVVTNVVGSTTSTPATLTVINLPRLTVGTTLTNLILTWPSDAGGFTVQSTTNLGPRAVWTTNGFPGPFMDNGQNSVTSSVSGPQRFFRLRQ